MIRTSMQPPIPSSGKFVLFRHECPEKETHLDLMLEVPNNKQLLCYRCDQSRFDPKKDSEWIFYACKQKKYLLHSGLIRPGMGSLMPIHKGQYKLTSNKQLKLCGKGFEYCFLIKLTHKGIRFTGKKMLSVKTNSAVLGDTFVVS